MWTAQRATVNTSSSVTDSHSDSGIYKEDNISSLWKQWEEALGKALQEGDIFCRITNSNNSGQSHSSKLSHLLASHEVIFYSDTKAYITEPPPKWTETES